MVSPMPGTVIRVEVEPGEAVRPRQPLVVLEAMKMEIPVHSPFGGRVKTVHVAAGERVAGGAVLVELGPELDGHHKDDRDENRGQDAREPDEVAEP